MSEQQQNPDEGALAKAAKWAPLVALLAAAVVLALYLAHFHGGFSEKAETWGQFGDYIGGILNPIIAGCALILLYHGISVQRLELKKAHEALTATRKVQEEQTRTLEKQRFEGTFFSLLDQHNKTIERFFADATSPFEVLLNKLPEKKKQQPYYLPGPTDLQRLKYARDFAFENHQSLVTYSRILFQALNLIASHHDNSDSKTAWENTQATPDELEYARIVLSFMPLSLRALIAVIYYSEEPSKDKYPAHLLINRYSVLEDVEPIFNRHTLTWLWNSLLTFYQPSAFQRN